MSTGPIVGLDAASVFVSDLGRAIEFYSGPLGLALGARDDARGCARLELDGARLVLETIDMGDPEERAMLGRHTGVALGVRDLDAARRALAEAGVEFEGEPCEQRSGVRGAAFADPDGNVLMLVQAR